MSNEGVPWVSVLFQVINFSLFAGILVYLLKKYIPTFLSQKRLDFLEYRKRALALEKQYEESCLKLENEIAELDKKKIELKTDVKRQ